MYILGALGILIFILCFVLLYYSRSNENVYVVNSKWTKKAVPNFGDLYFSNDLNRIVKVSADTPIKVIPKGKLRVGLVKNYDALILVDMRPKNLVITLNSLDQISTQGGVKINGTIDIRIKVKDVENLIFKLISNEEEDEKALISSFKDSIKAIVSEIDWKDLNTLKADLNKTIKERLFSDLNNVDSSFEIINISNIVLTTVNKEFPQILEDIVKDIEQEGLAAARAKAQQERLQIVNNWKIKQREFDRVMEEVETRHKSNLNELENVSEIEIAKKKHKLEIEKMIDLNNESNRQAELRVKLLGKYPQIMPFINPDFSKQMMEVELKELELLIEAEIKTNDLFKEFAYKAIDSEYAFTKGQIDILKERIFEKYGSRNVFNFSNTNKDKEV